METYVALIVATLLLVLIPGPNVAMIVAASVQHGFRAGLTAIMGTTTGVALQLILVLGGVAAIVELAALALSIIKWAGVAYLVWLGLRLWRSPPERLDCDAQSSGPIAFRRGLLIALLNPKTLLFNAAFLPQFVNSDTPAGIQLLVLSAIYLTVLTLGDTLWAAFAAAARSWLTKYGQLRNRLTGGLFLGAGLGLALSRRSV